MPPTDSPVEHLPRSLGFSLRTLSLTILVLCILLVVLKLFSDAVVNARRASIKSDAQSPLNQLALALQNYHDHWGEFPPAYLADADGTPMHSWRVLVLPYVEQGSLYEQYDFDEAWNGPKNSRLADKMPRVFHSHSEPESTEFTNIVVIVGPGTAFPGSRTTKFEEFTDGRENTILLTEITDSKINWLEPRDLNVETMSFSLNDVRQPSISSVYWRQPYVVFADSIKAYAVSGDMSPEALRGLTTIAGNESVTRTELEAHGFLK